MHQVDPLSLLLFIMILQYLSSLTRHVVDHKHYELYMLGDVKVESHLLFVDDVIFFSRASKKTF